MENLSISSRNKEDLFRVAKEEIPELNSGKKVIAILRKHGIEGKYDPEKWEEYIHVLETEKLSRLDEANSKTRASLVASIQSRLAKTRRVDGTVGPVIPDKCTVCGADTIREPKYDNKFGMGYGWRCAVIPGHSQLKAWEKIWDYSRNSIEEKLSEIEAIAKEQTNV